MLNLLSAWWEPLLSTTLTAMSAVITGLIGYGVTKLAAWLKTKIKNDKMATMAVELVELVGVAVNATQQTYVDLIKGTELWTEAAQKEALNKTLETVKKHLSVDMVNWITETYGELDDYIITLIESSVQEKK